MTAKRLLCIDDEKDIRDLIGDIAEGQGYAVDLVEDAEVFIDRFEAQPPTCIVLDLQIPKVDGIELIRQLSDRKCQSDIIIISGFDPRVLASAKRLGESHSLNIIGSLEKPISVKEFRSLLAQAEEGRGIIDEGNLRKALEAGQIGVYFQPKAKRSQNGDWYVYALEALARWYHPQRGVVSPLEFISLAEDTSLIEPLTQTVLQQSISALSNLKKRGIEQNCSVNLSAAFLRDLAFPDEAQRLAEEAGLTTDQITFEVTESTLMADPKQALDILSRFRLKGFGLSIDDFGTGYSSLVQLHRMPVTELKIDKSFLENFGKDSESALIMRTIVELGHNLGLTLCAEGVETEEALGFVGDLGCDAIQGFFISPPVPENSLQEVLYWRYSEDKPGNRSVAPASA